MQATKDGITGDMFLQIQSIVRREIESATSDMIDLKVSAYLADNKRVVDETTRTSTCTLVEPPTLWNV